MKTNPPMTRRVGIRCFHTKCRSGIQKCDTGIVLKYTWFSISIDPFLERPHILTNSPTRPHWQIQKFEPVADSYWQNRHSVKLSSMPTTFGIFQYSFLAAHISFTTNGQKFATSQHLDMSRCWTLALRCGKFVVQPSCRIVVSLSFGGVQHVRSRCPCSGVWHYVMVNGTLKSQPPIQVVCIDKITGWRFWISVDTYLLNWQGNNSRWVGWWLTGILETEDGHFAKAGWHGMCVSGEFQQSAPFLRDLFL